MKKGTVYIVGSGPGDPGLLTVKAKECLQEADVVVYDRLVDERILQLINPSAELLYVGKESSRHTVPQGQLNILLVKKAKENKIVVRLKGGDPFIFGRGGEEAETLASSGIHFEIVPGITSAIAAPAYAGIPVTHRDCTSTATFITGHEDPAKPDSKINWKNLAENDGTLVFLMGMENLEKITAELIKNGKSPATPAALIRYGTRPEQFTLTGTLKDIYENARKINLKPPVITIVGDVVKLRGKLRWYDLKPLFGKKIVITRARSQASGFSKKLEELGASCIEFPVIKIEEPDSWKPLDEAVKNIKEFHWIVFTSANALEPFFSRLALAGKDVRALGGLKIAAIGSQTASALEKYGIRADLVPDNYLAEGLNEAFSHMNIKGLKFLIPRAKEAREILPEFLKDKGAEVSVVEAYKTVAEGADSSELKKLFEDGKIDILTFASSSTVKNFHEIIGKEISAHMDRVKTICIGPITAKTAKELGYKVHAVPERYTIEAMVEECLKV